MDKKEVYNLIIRYLILIAVTIPNLYIFYLIFTPLTVYPVYFILKIIYGAQLMGDNIIEFGDFSVEIIQACIAGAAYYLLLVLNLTTKLSLKRRVGSIIFLFASFLILNVARIIIFSALYFEGFDYFDLTHKLVWYFGSTILVILIWFTNVWIFRVLDIPVYSDVGRIIRDIKKKEKNVRKKRR